MVDHAPTMADRIKLKGLNIMIKINIKDLLFINQFKDGNGPRPYLNGVFICKGGRIAATQGHLLGRMDEAFSGELTREFILDIDKDTQKFLKDNEKKGFVELDFCENGLAVELKIEDLTRRADIINYPIPDYNRLFDIESDLLAKIALNPDYLKKFAGGGKIKGVIMEFSKVGGPILIKNPNFGDRFAGLLMPMRL